MSLPRIAVTTGEPAGIGPDICLALSDGGAPLPPVLLGDRELLGQRARALGLEVELTDPDAAPAPGRLAVEHVPLRAPSEPGVLDPANSPYVIEQLERAHDGCTDGRYAAMVTAPVQKSVINDAGIAFTGHTEFLARRSGAGQVVMMLVAGGLRVALATTHLPLRSVADAIEADSLSRTLRVLDRDLSRMLGVEHPRILVLGLNPHAGESGHLGREELEIIAPVVRALTAQGLQLEGPLPADTAFTPRHLERADAVLAMYHDQGLPVLKHAGFGAAVNVTLGLPFLRASVDHGTALDLAATGRAEAGSLIAAMELVTDAIAGPAA